jgi:large subunit ribosomal protein LP0
MSDTKTASREYSEKKQAYFKKMNEYLDKYDKIMFVGCDNVTSRQFNMMRIGMRKGGGLPFVGNILMGKNTMMKKVLKDRARAAPEDVLKQEQYESMKQILMLNTGMIFTNDDLSSVKEMVEGNVVQAPAKVNSLAPCDVIIPSGNTGLEPGQTSFFQALNIHTKITKGTIEILNDVCVIKKGDRVGPSAATLLQKMGQQPFYYGLVAKQVYDSGSMYDPKWLDVGDVEKEAMIRAGINRVAAVSLALGWTNEASFPHVMMDAFKNILSISLGTDYDFEEFNGAQLKQDILSGKLTGPAAPAAGAGGGAAKASAPAPAPVEESEEEEADFGLFD